jgi:hypothetical protein
MFGLPKCYFGKYAKQAALPLDAPDDSKEEILYLDRKSTLVLEDLSEVGFLPNCCKDGLRREELRSALREIAMIHAVSWAFQHVTGEDLGLKYNLCEEVQEFVNGLMVSGILILIIFMYFDRVTILTLTNICRKTLKSLFLN